MRHERPMTRDEAVTLLCGFVALGICTALLLACCGCIRLTHEKPKDTYPAGWESLCIEQRKSAKDWYISKHGRIPVEPVVDVVMVDEPADKYWGLITYKQPRYLIQIWRDAPRRDTLQHEFRHALRMRNDGDGSEGGIRRRQ